MTFTVLFASFSMERSWRVGRVKSTVVVVVDVVESTVVAVDDVVARSVVAVAVVDFSGVSLSVVLVVVVSVGELAQPARAISNTRVSNT